MIMDKMREGAQSTAAKVIFVVIMVSFALAGIGGYAVRKPNTDPAEVNGVAINSMRFDAAYRQQKLNIQNQLGDKYADFIASRPDFLKNLRMQVLNGMIDGIILDQRAAKAGFMVSDEQIRQIIINDIDAFKVDGKFNNERYLNVITRYGYPSANEFAHDQKLSIAETLYRSPFGTAQFSLPYEQKLSVALLKQQRDLAVYTVNPELLSEGVAVTDDELKSYYDAHQSNYVQPEQVRLDYVLLSKAQLIQNQKFTDEEIATYYKDHQDRFSVPARFHAEHIFINLGKDEEAQKVQQAKAQQALKSLQDGMLFEEAATRYSEDVLTAKKGGDLEWQNYGVLEPEFDEAVKSLTDDTPFSPVITTKYGYHIIKLISRTEESVKPLADVAEEITSYMAREKADDLYATAFDRLSTLANEITDDLDQIGTEMNLKVEHSNLFDASTTIVPFNDRSVQKLAFSQSFRDDGFNSEAISLGDDSAIVFRVAEYKAQYVKPLEEVKDLLVKDFRLEKATELAASRAEDLKKLLSEGGDAGAFLTENKIASPHTTTVDRMASSLDPDVLNAAFALPKESAGFNGAVVKGLDGNQYLVVLKGVKEADIQSMTEDQLSMVAEQIKQSGGYRDQELMTRQLREDSDIEINTLALKQYESSEVSE